MLTVWAHDLVRGQHVWVYETIRGLVALILEVSEMHQVGILHL